MSAIQIDCQQVYRSPTKGRRYLTPKAAADAEARAQMDRKYPREEAEYEQGQTIYNGWHWSADQKHVEAHKHLARRILKHLRAAVKARSA